jgi:hypothetical protein
MAKNLQKFSTLHQHVKAARSRLKLPGVPEAFPFVLLPLIVGLREDEVEATITDNHFQKVRKRAAGHDRGTDTIHIETDGTDSTIHIFNLKYKADFDKTDGFFPSSEIDKVMEFIRAVHLKDLALLGDANQVLIDKVREIWDEVENRRTNFILHFASNLTEGFAPDEDRRLQNLLSSFNTVSYDVETQSTIAARLADKNRKRINGKLIAIDKNLFETSGGSVRALVVHADAVQVLRLLCDDPALRGDPQNTDLALLKTKKLEDGAFDDNVRIYLKQKPKINKNIKATALSNENVNFFYFNNGLTMTCDHLNYQRETRAPVIELENVQVVNGGQTLHALFDAFQEEPTKLTPVELLCRIYETKDRELSSRIAERTNSQSPVNTRDIHSIDIEQINLEREFEALDLFYERKRAQFEHKPIHKRVDAEKCGQVYLAFYEEMPLEAKNRKGMIFGSKYDVIFSSNTTAEKLLLPLRLFDHIEAQRAATATGRRAWLNYASYHILFALKLLATKKKIELTYRNLGTIRKLYAAATAVVRKARNAERKRLTKRSEDFADVLYFKQKKAKEDILALT